jgi:hypothetical protein
MALVKLVSAGGYAEGQLIKGLLSTEGIECVVQGESRNTDMGTEAGFGEIAILVNEEDLEEAKQVLDARPVAEAPESGSTIGNGAVCPVHEQPATAVCSRCGTHLCAACGPVGDPPICESCDERLAQQPRTRNKTKVVALVMLAIFFGLPTIAVIVLRVLFGSR